MIFFSPFENHTFKLLCQKHVHLHEDGVVHKLEEIDADLVEVVEANLGPTFFFQFSALWIKRVQVTIKR